jgi:hypothetical protein
MPHPNPLAWCSRPRGNRSVLTCVGFGLHSARGPRARKLFIALNLTEPRRSHGVQPTREFHKPREMMIEIGFRHAQTRRERTMWHDPPKLCLKPGATKGAPLILCSVYDCACRRAQNNDNHNTATTSPTGYFTRHHHQTGLDVRSLDITTNVQK